MDSNDVNFLRRYEKSGYLSVGEQGHSVRKIQSQLLKGICDTLLVSEPDSVKLHFRQLFAVQNENADCISVFIPEAVSDIKSVICLSELPPERQEEVKRQVAYDFSYLAAKARKLIEARPKPDKMIFLRFFYNPDFAGGLGAFLHLPDSDDNIFIVNGRIPVVALYGYRINPYRNIGGAVAQAGEQDPAADQDWRFHHPLDSLVPGQNGEAGEYRSLNYDWSDRVGAENLVSENTPPGSRFPAPTGEASESVPPEIPGSSGSVSPESVPEAPVADEFESYAPGESSFQGASDAAGTDESADDRAGKDSAGEEKSEDRTEDKAGVPPFVKWLTVFVLAALLAFILVIILWFVLNPGKPLSAMLPWHREPPILTVIPEKRDPEVPEGATTETPVSGTPVPDTVSGKYTSDTVTVPGSPASDQGDSLPGALTGASDDGNATAGSQDPSLYNPEFDTETGGASGGADDDSLEPNAGGTGDSGLPGGAESLSGPREASGEFSGNGDLPAPDGAVASHGTGEFREDSGGSGSAGAPGEPGSPGNPGSYLKISYRDIGPSEEEGGRRVAYTVTDENNNVRCSLRGRVAGIDRGRVFFIDENVKIGNGCDISSFPKEMLCYDSDGSFCRAIPRNGGQKGFVQYVKLSKDKS